MEVMWQLRGTTAQRPLILWCCVPRRRGTHPAARDSRAHHKALILFYSRKTGELAACSAWHTHTPVHAPRWNPCVPICTPTHPPSLFMIHVGRAAEKGDFESAGMDRRVNCCAHPFSSYENTHATHTTIVLGVQPHCSGLEMLSLRVPKSTCASLRGKLTPTTFVQLSWEHQSEVGQLSPSLRQPTPVQRMQPCRDNNTHHLHPQPWELQSKLGAPN